MAINPYYNNNANTLAQTQLIGESLQSSDPKIQGDAATLVANELRGGRPMPYLPDAYQSGCPTTPAPGDLAQEAKNFGEGSRAALAGASGLAHWMDGLGFGKNPHVAGARVPMGSALARAGTKTGNAFVRGMKVLGPVGAAISGALDYKAAADIMNQNPPASLGKKALAVASVAADAFGLIPGIGLLGNVASFATSALRDAVD